MATKLRTTGVGLPARPISTAPQTRREWEPPGGTTATGTLSAQVLAVPPPTDVAAGATLAPATGQTSPPPTLPAMEGIREPTTLTTGRSPVILSLRPRPTTAAPIVPTAAVTPITRSEAGSRELTILRTEETAPVRSTRPRVDEKHVVPPGTATDRPLTTGGAHRSLPTKGGLSSMTRRRPYRHLIPGVALEPQ